MLGRDTKPPHFSGDYFMTGKQWYDSLPKREKDIVASTVLDVSRMSEMQPEDILEIVYRLHLAMIARQK